MFCHPSVPHHYIFVCFNANSKIKYQMKKSTKCLKVWHWCGDSQGFSHRTYCDWSWGFNPTTFTPLLLWQREKSCRTTVQTSRLTLHSSDSAEFDLNINPAISVGKNTSLLSGPLLETPPHPSIHLHLYSPPCCLLEGIHCKMWW